MSGGTVAPRQAGCVRRAGARGSCRSGEVLLHERGGCGGLGSLPLRGRCRVFEAEGALALLLLQRLLVSIAHLKRGGPVEKKPQDPEPPPAAKTRPPPPMGEGAKAAAFMQESREGVVESSVRSCRASSS